VSVLDLCNQVKDGLLEDFVKIRAQDYLPGNLPCYIAHDSLCSLIQHLVKGLQISTIFLGLGVLTWIDLEIFRIVELFRNLQNPVEMMEELFGLLTICLFDIVLVDLYDVGKAIDHELLQERTVDDWIVIGFDENGLERIQILQFGNLQQ
jgi:hypothetical protein